MSRKNENQGFICENCGSKVMPLNNGSYRNHCPFCLYSKHVDNIPGDRASECGGLMKPIDIKNKSGKGFQIIFICLECGIKRANIIATDTIQADCMNEIIKLSTSKILY